MHNFRRYYYKNKYKIWGIIIFIVLLLMSIQFINGLMAKQNNMNLNKNVLGNTDLNVNKNYNSNTQVITNESIISGEIVNSTQLEEASKIIQLFIDACNNKNLENAYNLLSEDCKNEMYQDIQKFKSLYYDNIFKDTRKVAIIENWNLNTYKLTITDDIMETGKISDKKMQDYITVVEENNQSKLNINSYIGKKDINKTQTEENIIFNIINKNIYLDYEEYVIQVQNKTNNAILLDTQKNTKSIYLEDSKGIKYYSYSHELLSSLLKINKGFSTQFKIKFSKAYGNSSAKINSLVFSDVITNTNEIINSKKVINISI